MIRRLMLWLFTVGLACGLIATGLSHDSDSMSITYRVNTKFAVVKHISKRNVVCVDNTEYPFNTSLDVVCCETCQPGYVAKTIGCTKENPKTSCKNCTRGKEYMDRHNYKTQCFRCSGCDEQHGMEVEKNCTIDQNTKCRCKPGFFCESPPCHHCDACDTCANNRILEPCTQTKNTVCEGNLQFLWLILPVCVLVLIGCGYILWKKCNNKRKKCNNNKDEPNIEMEPLMYPDIDLSKHITDIAEPMSLQEVLKLVRKLGVLSSTIDTITNDNRNFTDEEKIKLLEQWYQQNGIKGAYNTLMSALKELQFHVIADKIEKKIQPVSTQS